MKKIGKWIILKATEYEEIQKFYPLYEKALKLARMLTEDQIDEILDGKRHTRRNPGKRKALIPEEDRQEFGPQGNPGAAYGGVYPPAGE